MIIGDERGYLPVILTSRGRRHRNQFTHGRKNTKVTNPNNDETVNDTSCTTIVETLGEEHEDSFPCNEDGAREAKNREESEVALQPSVVDPIMGRSEDVHEEPASFPYAPIDPYHDN